MRNAFRPANWNDRSSESTAWNFAVDQLDLEIYHRVAGDGAAGGCVLDPFLDRRPPVLRYRAAEDLVDEFESAASRQPFEDARSFAELSAASGLFLVTADYFDAAPEGFEVSDLGRMKLDFDAVSLLQLVHGDFDVSLPRSRKQKLIRLRLAIESQSQVLLEHLVNRLRELVFVVARLRLDGKGDCRPGEVNRLIRNRRWPCR